SRRAPPPAADVAAGEGAQRGDVRDELAAGLAEDPAARAQGDGGAHGTEHERRRGMSTSGSGAARVAARITSDDLHLFNEGTHYRLHEKLGAHVLAEGGVSFAVWAPNARYVSVVGDFNGWDRGRHPMTPVGGS